MKFTPLLESEPTVTSTLPVVAPLGTDTTMLVAVQLAKLVAAVLPKVTELPVWLDPRFVPVMVICVPTAPELWLRLVMIGEDVVTVKLTPLLDAPPTVTTTLPVVAPLGTGTTMLVALQFVGDAVVPLNVTVLVPCVEPKLVPVMVTEVPTSPEVGLRLLMLGEGVVTVKLTPLLATPPTVTTTLPVVAPLGTGTTMLVALQLVGDAAVLLNVTVLVPCVEPKLVPAMVTEVPTSPEVGLRLLMLGEDVVTVKLTPLLVAPSTVTTTLPVVAPLGTGTTMLVALQLVGEAVVPLKTTVLVPCVEPKLVPAMVTEAPTSPEVGLRLLMLGEGVVTVKLTALLAAPPTVTTTLPVVAPLGTGTTMLVALQLVGDAAVLLNATVLVPCVEPKLVPAMVTEVPTSPEVGLRLLMLGEGVVTVKLTALLVAPSTVTTTLPVVAPLGTGTTMLVALQLVGDAVVPLNVTALALCVAPKFVPVTVTDMPPGPELGFTLVMLGNTPEPLPAARKATICMIHAEELDNDAVAL